MEKKNKPKQTHLDEVKKKKRKKEKEKQQNLYIWLIKM